jgi:hypothetical protein
VSKSAKNDNQPRTAANDNRATATRARHPWADAIDGIDYGPAIAAIGDLVAWAFDLAADDVADWPEGKRRVRTTRKYVLSRLRGQRPRGVPFEDVLFTAGLLARIFEAEVGLGMSQIVAVLDRIGLPTEVVPLMPRPQRSAPSVRAVPNTRTAPRKASSEVLVLFADTLRRLHAEGLLAEDEPDAVPCPGCDHAPRYRNAA